MSATTSNQTDETTFVPMPASEEIINMLAQAPHVLEFSPSERAKRRVWELVDREKQGVLTEDEKNELEHYAHLEHVMRLVKARARKLRSVSSAG